MSLELDLKNQMDKLIDYAYRDDTFEYKQSFKWYKIVIKNEENKKAHGTYHIKGDEKYTIDLYQNLEKAETNANRIKTLIHEIAHHIQYRRNRNNPDIKAHGKEFYDEYTKLLYAAFDLKMFTPHEFLTRLYDSKDDDKINEIVKKYIPTDIDAESDEQITVNVYNSFAIKDDLKKLGFKWNGLSKAWYITVNKEDREFVEKDVRKLGVDDEDIEVTSKWNLKMITDKKAHPVNFSIKEDYLNEFEFFLTKLLDLDETPIIRLTSNINYPYYDSLNNEIVLAYYDDSDIVSLVQTVFSIAKYSYCAYQIKNDEDDIKKYLKNNPCIGNDGFSKKEYELKSTAFSVFINGQLFKIGTYLLSLQSCFDEDDITKEAAKTSYNWPKGTIDNSLRKTGFNAEKLERRIKQLGKAII